MVYICKQKKIWYIKFHEDCFYSDYKLKYGVYISDLYINMYETIIFHFTVNMSYSHYKSKSCTHRCQKKRGSNYEPCNYFKKVFSIPGLINGMINWKVVIFRREFKIYNISCQPAEEEIILRYIINNCRLVLLVGIIL